MTYWSLTGYHILKWCPYCSFWQHLWSQFSFFCLDLLENSQETYFTSKNISSKYFRPQCVLFCVCVLLNTSDLRPPLHKWQGTKPWHRRRRMCYDVTGPLAIIYLLWCEWGKDCWENVTDTDTWQESTVERQKLTIPLCAVEMPWRCNTMTIIMLRQRKMTFHRCACLHNVSLFFIFTQCCFWWRITMVCNSDSAIWR